ncbi:MAG: hypothetical protein M0Z33_13370 [Actinomycetota bacterium]|nr:hypothetical protein [Actinomycetota bacterium]
MLKLSAEDVDSGSRKRSASSAKTTEIGGTKGSSVKYKGSQENEERNTQAEDNFGPRLPHLARIRCS